MVCRNLFPLFFGLTLLALPPGTLPPFLQWTVCAASAKPPVTATEPPDTAAEHFRAGRSAFLRQRFDEAAVHFQKAWQLDPRDFLLFNLAVCYERLNRPADAITHYRRYLRKVPAETEALEPRIRDLRRQLEPCRIRIGGGLSGSDVWVDGRFAGQLPLKHPIWATPGSEVVLRVLKTGYHPYQTTLRVQAGTSVQFTISQVPLDAPGTKAEPIVTILSTPLSRAVPPPIDLRAEPVPSRGSQLPITLGVAGTILVSAGLCLGAYAWWKSGQTDGLASWEWQQRDELERDSRRAAWGADALLITGTALVAAFGWMALQD